MQQIVVLGATGSIGVSTLKVLALHPERYQVFALTAHSQLDKLLEQCLQFRPRYAVLTEPQAAEEFNKLARAAGLAVDVLAGVDALCQVASHPDVDQVMAAIVGYAGLAPTLAAAKAGKKVLLANKEALVCAGQLLLDAVRDSGAQLLPIDSEHNAIFQCLPFGQTLAQAKVSHLLLTASGGPFRQWSHEQMLQATPEQACAHPNWSMGRKISVDSASLMNKGLELIEACWLFDARPEQIHVVVHPQSIVHSMVQYDDGSLLAELGNPDMCTPIAYGLAWPERICAGVAPLDLIATGQLQFEAPDDVRFPALRLAREAFNRGQSSAIVLNAANEVAVARFLNRQLAFTDIAVQCEWAMNHFDFAKPQSLADVAAIDAQVRTQLEKDYLRAS